MHTGIKKVKESKENVIMEDEEKENLIALIIIQLRKKYKNSLNRNKGKNEKN